MKKIPQWGEGGVLRISSDRDDQTGGKNQNPKNSLDQILTPIKSHSKFLRPSLGEFFFWRTTLRCRHKSSECFEYPKNPYLNQSTQENTCQIFLPKKNSRIETFKSKRILWSSPSLEIRSNLPPLVYYSTWGTTMVTACSAAEARYFPCPFLSCSFFSVLLPGHTTEEACATSCLIWNWSVLFYPWSRKPSRWVW